MRKVFIISVGLGMLLASAAFAQQRQPCAPHDYVVQRLTEKYGEYRISVGFQNQSTLIEVWANLETGTWTIIQRRADGTSCIATSGLYYRSSDIEAPGTDS